jgi:hypothetical protein
VVHYFCNLAISYQGKELVYCQIRSLTGDGAQADSEIKKNDLGAQHRNKQLKGDYFAKAALF